MHIDLIKLWSEMGIPVRAVVAVLTLQAIACIAVILDRRFMLLRSRARARRFAREAKPLLDAGDFAALRRVSGENRVTHLPALLEVGLEAFANAKAKGLAHDKAALLARRALERRGDTMSKELHRGMSVIASTGSTAPFVGLLGTVLGIIHAFEMIAANGSGGIATIGASIGEALIVTGYGLVVAIPSVLAFNWLSGLLDDYEHGLESAAGELADRLESTVGPVSLGQRHETSESGADAAGDLVPFAF